MIKAGPAKIQPASERRLMPLPPRASIQRRRSRMRSASASIVSRKRAGIELPGHRALGDDAQLLRDPLPFGHRGRRHGALELVAEGGGVAVARQHRRAPDAAPRRQIAGQLEEAQLHVGPRQIFDELPGRLLALGAGEDGKAGAAGDRGAGPRPAPASGAVIQSSCRSGGSRRLNSPIFHGPLKCRRRSGRARTRHRRWRSACW